MPNCVLMPISAPDSEWGSARLVAPGSTTEPDVGPSSPVIAVAAIQLWVDPPFGNNPPPQASTRWAATDVQGRTGAYPPGPGHPDAWSVKVTAVGVQRIIAVATRAAAAVEDERLGSAEWWPARGWPARR